jgi:hypothetical protein
MADPHTGIHVQPDPACGRRLGATFQPPIERFPRRGHRPETGVFRPASTGRDHFDHHNRRPGRADVRLKQPGVKAMDEAFRAGLVWLFAVAALVACGAWLLANSASRLATPRIVLTSGTDFGLRGSVSNLTPGVLSPLTLSVTNPYSVPIRLMSVTVTMSRTSSPAPTPAACPANGLSLVSGSRVQHLVRGTGEVTLRLHSPQPVVPASSRSVLSPFSILLARTAGNSCQLVTFPFRLLATASPESTASRSSTSPVPPSGSSPPVLPSGSLPVTGAQVVRLVGGGLALFLAGLVMLALARRRRLMP